MFNKKEKRERIETTAQTGTNNKYIQLVKKPGFFSNERKTELKTIEQDFKFLAAVDCLYCDCNNSLEPGDEDWCWKCNNLMLNIRARKTYLRGGAVVAPRSPYYKVAPQAVAEVDENGNLIRLPGGVDVKFIVAAVIEQMHDEAEAEKKRKAAEKNADNKPDVADAEQTATKKPSKTRSAATSDEKPKNIPAKKEEIPHITDPFDGIDAGSKKPDEPEQLSVDDYDELNGAPLPPFLKD